MKTFKEYLKLYPQNLGWFDDPISDRGQNIISYGMLKFTEETSYNWCGPFEGDYAMFKIEDFTPAFTYANGKPYSLLKYLEEKHIKKERQAAYFNKTYSKPKDEVSFEFPIRFYICGNDDTSYSKFYKTVNDVMFDFNLLESFEPINFQDVKDLGFVFTN